MKKIISIIIPCYNAEKCLSVAIDSIFEQSYKNLEIIIVNDGSSDDTLEVANSYAKLDSRIHVLTQENAGVSVARNNGLNFACGDYVMFLDADDNYTSPIAIERMVKKLEEVDADMCVCNFVHPCFEQHTKGDRVYEMENDKDFLEFYQDFFVFGMPWNKITKRQCLTEKFIPGVKFNEDELYNIDNLHNIRKVVYIDEVLHNYYCAPYDSKSPASAVNSIYSQDLFWEKKSSIWHMGMKNHEYRIKSLTRFFPNKIDDLQYVRSFDFLFWDFFLMAKNRVKEEHVFYTIKSIFENELFQKTLKSKERYGIKVLSITNKKIKEFVCIAYNAFIDIKLRNKRLSMLKVFCALFGYFFFKNTAKCNTIDVLALSMYEHENLISAEGWFVKNILEKYYKKQTEKENSILTFKRNIEIWRGEEKDC